MSSMLTKEITKKAVHDAVSIFWENFLGWTPDEVRVVLTEDLTIVMLKGTLPPAEQKMAATPEGRMRMKQMRSALLEEGRDGLTQAIVTSTRARVVRTLTAIDVSANEERFAFVFGTNGAEPLKDGLGISGHASDQKPGVRVSR